MNDLHRRLLAIYMDLCNDTQLIITAKYVGGERKCWETNYGLTIIYQKLPSGNEDLRMYTKEQGQVFYALWENWVDPISIAKLIQSLITFLEERVETPLHSN